MSDSAPSPWVLVAGGTLGLLGVVAGAFGAHALREAVSPRDLEIWQTGAHYQQVHAVVLIVLGLMHRGEAPLRWAAVLMVLGILVFSGTLYAMVLGGPRVLGAITPLGGVSLIAGWAALAAAGLGRLRRPAASSR
jgi:uncharacterized membrane protein YgdD (TMEM256/DUF423 family)